MFTLTVYLVQKSLVKEIIASAPPEMPNVFLVGVTPEQVTPLKQLIAAQAGVLGVPELGPSVSARLVSIDGEAIADRLADGEVRGTGRRFTNTRSVTWESVQPTDIHLLQGQWWSTSSTDPQVSVDQDAARMLQIDPGSMIEVEVSGRTIRARVAAIHELTGFRATPSTE